MGGVRVPVFTAHPRRGWIESTAFRELHAAFLTSPPTTTAAAPPPPPAHR